MRASRRVGVQLHPKGTPFSAFRWGRHSADEVGAATIDGLSMLGSVELSLRCQGESTPTVIFMPGGGAALPTSPLPPWMPSLRTGFCV
jgi:hypothetical protein